MATNTIREQIILAVISKLADMRTANGYNTEAGAYVYRATHQVNPSDLPCLMVWPEVETSAQEYSANLCQMQIRVEAAATIGSTNPSVTAELLLGDLIECMTGIEYTLAFTSGGTYTVAVGNTITGATSAATAYISGVSLGSGSWAGGDAAGTFSLRRVTGAFQAEDLDIGANLNVATIAGAPTGSLATVTTTGDLAEAVIYMTGGPPAYPDTDDTVVGCQAYFQINYQTVSGDPYTQP